ncbi:hypothetical protein E2C01_064293 [Portunus trituberculatus]|uniref:Uncharacterized protein n=1 Tax=Portunus trituberculatus TaxID=210409 RepID=A0A5B7HJC5_PORTR|nr:hypothetical protein [Portunus trituberculatus]
MKTITFSCILSTVFHFISAENKESNESAKVGVSHSPPQVGSEESHQMFSWMQSSNQMSLINTSFSTKAAFEEYRCAACCKNSSVTVAEEA